MTYLVYLDEQEGVINGQRYTAIVGFRVNSKDINVIRRKFYPALNEIVDTKLRRDGKIYGGDAHIHKSPILHGCDFLRGYSDTEKFQVLDCISDSIEGSDFNFIRIGYFNNSLSSTAILNDRRNILSLALLSVGFALWDKPDDDFILVSEIDKEALRLKIQSIFNDVGIYYSSPQKVSFNLKRLIGHFYAPKEDLGCQIADVVNYCCLQKTTGKSQFQQRMATCYERFKDSYIVNQIIWVNDPARNYNLDQIYRGPQPE